jgi:hypothetical protein
VNLRSDLVGLERRAVLLSQVNPAAQDFAVGALIMCDILQGDAIAGARPRLPHNPQI